MIRNIDSVVVVAGARTPQGKLNGSLSSLSATALGSKAIQGALERARIPPTAVEAVIAGQVLQAGVGQNPARQAALGAGIPWSAHTATVNKVCLSGLTAVIDAIRMIQLGDASVVVAVGMESMSNAPHLLQNVRTGWRFGTREAIDHMAFDGLTDAYEPISMGTLAERDNDRLRISREQQDLVAADSHARVAKATADGIFKDEIIPVAVKGAKNSEVIISVDEGFRTDTDVHTLGSLKPSFRQGGSVTAGNSSQISDGAAAVVLASKKVAEEQGWKILAEMGSNGQVAGPDTLMYEQPARAIFAACVKENIAPEELDFVEINEAFAGVIVRSSEMLGMAHQDVNIHGGGIALGHPIGASGTRLVVHTVHELNRRGSGTAAVSLCGGGGQGEALILKLNNKLLAY